jgi:serine protease Do
MVIAIGNPLGLGHTVTSGIVSQTDRNLSEVFKEEQIDILFIQTDTAINPGSSGGPLITLSGAWIGVNTAGVTTAQNIGFAVPSKKVIEFLEKIRKGQGKLESQKK